MTKCEVELFASFSCGQILTVTWFGIGAGVFNVVTAEQRQPCKLSIADWDSYQQETFHAQNLRHSTLALAAT